MEMVITALTGALKTTMAPEFLLNSSHSLEEVYTGLFELITRGVCARSDIEDESRRETVP